MVGPLLMLKLVTPQQGNCLVLTSDLHLLLLLHLLLHLLLLLHCRSRVLPSRCVVMVVLLASG
jgi:hypothetical protein